jgi:hypothetical protein
LPRALTRSFDSSAYHYDLGLFDIDYAADIEALDATIQALYPGQSVSTVVPGADPGVELAERLGKRWGCQRRNVDALAAARYHKLHMQERLSAAGHPIAKTVRVSTVCDAARFLGEEGWTRRVIVKPPRSSATDRVKRCDVAHAADAAGALLGTSDNFGNVIDHVILQEFLEGEEFCVNAISISGRHYFTDIWRYRKHLSRGAPLYDYDELVAPSEAPAGLVTLAAAVLDAVGIMFGASHIEIMATPAGPRLIEVSPRLEGGVNPLVFERALGCDIILLAAQAMLHPHELGLVEWPKIGGFPVLRPRQRVRGVYLIAPRDGRLRVKRVADFLSKLDSYFPDSFAPLVGDGDEIAATTDLLSSPGMLFLASEDEAALERDYRQIRKREAAEFYL